MAVQRQSSAQQRAFETGTSGRHVCTRMQARHGMALAFFVALLCLMIPAAPAHCAKAPTDTQVKAAFLYNFARFVEWPAQSFPSADTPIVIGVVGDGRFADAVDQISRGKTVNGRRLVVKRLGVDSNMDNCHLLFIPADEKRHIGRILTKVKDADVLTVGETEGFVQSGGVMGFVIQDSKVTFDINAGAAKRKRLKISSQLLKLARNVRE